MSNITEDPIYRELVLEMSDMWPEMLDTDNERNPKASRYKSYTNPWTGQPVKELVATERYFKAYYKGFYIGIGHMGDHRFHFEDTGEFVC